MPSVTPAPPTVTSTSPAATATPVTENLAPSGFPVDPGTRLGSVEGEVGARIIDWTGGATALEYSRDLQPSADPVAANSMGWNCRVHVEYEGVPAVDWYIPTGTPIYATSDGRATLYIVSLPNAFDYYGVDREPYLGNPDRSRAPLSSFPGPGGGKGVYVEVVNDAFTMEYAHLELDPTLQVLPADAYLESFSAAYAYESIFGVMRPFNQSTAIATWPVNAGDLIGYSGDSGYSEAAHLHYTVRRTAGSPLCPTSEPGFSDANWLFR